MSLFSTAQSVIHLKIEDGGAAVKFLLYGLVRAALHSIMHTKGCDGSYYPRVWDLTFA